MLRPGVARLAKVKRSASVPWAAMPAGNSLRVFFSICAACLGFMRPVVRLAISASSEMPSMMSMGSSVLPLLLLIFWPSLSRTKACT